ncbi:MAG TPA: dephospho-CoA kinase [Verrucomicrobiae bacterium]|nr:dephospho-CoA kinase [Verrucomicrobiae bacterium]
MKRLIKVGLTGGIATGKSTTLQRWQQAGAAGIDTDDLAHRTLAPHTATWDEVVRTFGTEILNDDGTVNRPTLGEIVFADESKRLALNRIIHPAVHEMWAEEMQKLECDGKTQVVVVSVPLLYEVAAETEFDCVVAVGCSEQTQLARLKQKGLTEDQARARIRAQWPLQLKMDRADFVIWNDGSPRVHSEQADIIWATIKESYHAPSKN